MKLIVMIPLAALVATPSAAAGDPTCSDSVLNVEVHGQHVVRDYVTGGEIGNEWPPRSMRDMVDNDGAAVPGGPGPGFHFQIGVPPGASFCVDSQSWHVYGDDD